MSTSSRRSNPSALPPPSSFQRTGPFYNSPIMTSPATSPLIHQFDQHRSTSPSRVRLHAPLPIPSLRFTVDRSVSTRQSITAQRSNTNTNNNKKRTCLCSPTTHPGSFRCALHKNVNNNQSVSYSPNRLNMRRSAMTNSLVRIGTVEGDLVKRALAALIRPSSHQLRRRGAFQPRLSRLSVMSKAQDD